MHEINAGSPRTLTSHVHGALRNKDGEVDAVGRRGYDSYW